MIRFRRLIKDTSRVHNAVVASAYGKPHVLWVVAPLGVPWEEAVDEEDLKRKLNGAFAEVQMPAKPWYVQLYRFFLPRRGLLTVRADGKIREATIR